MLPTNLETQSPLDRGIRASRSLAGAARSHLRLPLFRNGYALIIGSAATSDWAGVLGTGRAVLFG